MFLGFPISYFVFELLLFGLFCGTLWTMWWGWSQKWGSRHCFLGCGGGLFFFGVLFYGSFVEPQLLQVREVSVQDENLPSLRLVLFSDVHVGPYKGLDWVTKVVNRVNDIEDVDGVLIPGDFLFGGADRYLSHLDPLRDLKVNIKVATLGNHDHEYTEPLNTQRSTKVRNRLKDLGFLVLDNQSFYWQNKQVSIVGTDDNDLGFHDVSQAFLSVRNPEKSIYLAHSPDIVDDLEEAGIVPGLTVTGHSHCGQIRLPWVGALPFIIPTKYGRSLDRHYYEREGRKLFVTCGVGEVGTRARLLNLPEIVVLDIN